MISTAREILRNLRAGRLERVRPSRLQDVLQSIRWIHREHVKDLLALGYSPKEAFWLNFACLPFLPWDASAGPEMRLSELLKLYADLHHSTVGPLPPADAQAFLDLLKQRYRTIRRNVAESESQVCKQPGVDPTVCTDNGPPKWALAGLIITRTARAWQQHRSTFPCRLVEDV
jgi:hypothetical protein